MVYKKKSFFLGYIVLYNLYYVIFNEFLPFPEDKVLILINIFILIILLTWILLAGTWTGWEMAHMKNIRRQIVKDKQIRGEENNYRLYVKLTY